MKNFRLFLASLLIACLVWAMHTFSLMYSATLRCSVHVTTNLSGYAPEAVAQEQLVLRGKATGFAILKARGSGRRPLVLTVPVDGRYLHREEGQEDRFYIQVPEIRDKLVESFGERFAVEFIETERLTVTLTPQSSVMVPVVPSLDLSFRPQYMQVGEVSLKPDSVRVYGAVKELQRITQVRTHSISEAFADKPIQGYVALEPLPGLRLETERVWFEVEVERYVENRMQLPVTLRNVPAGRSLMVLPSQVELIFRAPFRPRGGRIVPEDLSLVVDYADYAGAGSTRVIPRLETKREIYAWRLNPEVVECLQVDGR